MNGCLQVAKGPASRFSIFLTSESSEGGVITGMWALEPDRTVSHGFVSFNLSVCFSVHTVRMATRLS